MCAWNAQRRVGEGGRLYKSVFHPRSLVLTSPFISTTHTFISAVMNSRFVLFFVTFLAMALFTSATPVPNNDAAIAKRALKQYDARRGVPKRRDDQKFKPSKIWHAAEPEATA
ncbi:hypothetical protein BD414DRAFT_476988 [Trametes punicea]|nr:hypothetical protein BD414DRAFT_476988 [Trametes punicea]